MSTFFIHPSVVTAGNVSLCEPCRLVALCLFKGLLLTWLILPGDAAAADPYAAARDRLVRERVASAGVTDARVLDSIRTTPRHEFVPVSQRERAYFDMALPIGSSQTISSPFIVASMTEALDPQATDKVLEIGTGSGYQAAVLSPLVEHVYSIEIVQELGEQAKQTLTRLGYPNVSTRIGDGFLGWPDAAPFDKIIVTCSPESVPQPLVDQLREGGQMIIPVGERYQQTLYRMTKQDGKLVRQPLRPTLFVPMTGEAEDERQLKPDPANPTVINGDFQQAAQGDQKDLVDYVPGWYYGRQVQRVSENGADGTEENSAAGDQAFARFTNQTPGLSSHLLQGIAISGLDVSMIRLAGKCRTSDVQKGPTSEAMPMVAITFYDKLRQDLGTFWIGPFRGSRPWRSSSRLVRVPPQTKEAILRVGLFGATGTADFDEVSIQKVD
ncbi:Protein-L-isoaspartate O-methyltransferase [Rubripirellula lacrimiformis]|uniref:Protein-L-isoaspartate O-methyltransferase n=1 Tax=Rubripirellula lacrimiformis TaxID=1930273 RepID=A0A517N6L3_9BACT|nr:protein-L-isoaspartate(D-aspartate) O-methyltransferase [Rubripirellula lacrimiformis]QDT02772.1 Protein-L-isoaspartate O-methyltransferase [Rubripirellula lacrimiformis]